MRETALTSSIHAERTANTLTVICSQNLAAEAVGPRLNPAKESGARVSSWERQKVKAV